MVARSLAVGALILCMGVAGGSPAFGQTDEQVTAARARGVKFLKQQQKSDGSWAFTGHDVGITALCTIALIENGVALNDPGVQKGYEYVKKNSDSLTTTYDLSLVIVLLSRFGDRRDKGQIKGFAARLIAGQMDSGGWHYTCPGQKLDAEKVLKDPSSGPKPKEGYGITVARSSPCWGCGSPLVQASTSTVLWRKWRSGSSRPRLTTAAGRTLPRSRARRPVRANR